MGDTAFFYGCSRRKAEEVVGGAEGGRNVSVRQGARDLSRRRDIAMRQIELGVGEEEAGDGRYG